MAVEKCPVGWLFGNFDGFVGQRIYPGWRGALDGKILICRDVRVQNGEYFVHNPFTNVIERYLGTDIKAVEAYVLEHGKVAIGGTNVWD